MTKCSPVLDIFLSGECDENIQGQEGHGLGDGGPALNYVMLGKGSLSYGVLGPAPHAECHLGRIKREGALSTQTGTGEDSWA